jgi:UPF0755 protein
MWKTFKRLLLLLVLCLLGGVAYGWWFLATPIKLAADSVPFSISPGNSLRAATREMKQAGIRVAAVPFELLGRAQGIGEDIKAGSYQIERGATPLDLLEKITRGDFAYTEVRFVEGGTFRQLRAVLDEHPELRHDTSGLKDSEIMSRLGTPNIAPEGLFYPDTYRVTRDASDLDVLRAAQQAMQKQLAAAWAERDPTVPLANEYEALILASIIEKESGQSADRAQVAAVFANRLRMRMRLQTDPTVIYGLGERFDGNLRKRDLEADSPYNTYLRVGLPPTPIAMPGLPSLRAATKPPQSDALYFVGRGDGSSEFSRSLNEHNRAVRKYQLGGNK